MVSKLLGWVVTAALFTAGAAAAVLVVAIVLGWLAGVAVDAWAGVGA